ncbi:lysophospholipase [Candidatus Woesearchaeota archaeon]|nr:lysophospholipase [Candidatus Woesearchaeota archaeon]
MTEKKLFIKNRDGKKIAVLLDIGKKGLVFLMHGLSGRKEHEYIQKTGEAFKEADYTTVKFDTRNTFGESEGNYEDANITNYYEDLEDVINWAKTQEWYQEPFVLVGQSLGGICTAQYAENHPKEIKALAPISTVISWELKIKDPEYQKKVAEWDKTGWRISKSKTRGFIKKLKWKQFKEDYMKYDLLKDVKKLTMPVLMLVGEKDDSTPPERQKVLFNALPEKKEFHIIKDAEHTIRGEKQLEELKQIFKNWIKKI